MKRIIVWLTDEEYRKYEHRAEVTGVGFQQLATWLICRWMDPEGVPSLAKKKKLKKWLLEHEHRTKAEKGRPGLSTLNRIEVMMRESGEAVWSTTRIREGLGWKRAGQLNEMLREDERFERTEAPEDAPRNRGAQPYWWRLIGSS